MGIREGLRNAAQKVTNAAAIEYRNRRGIPQREQIAPLQTRIVEPLAIHARQQAREQINSSEAANREQGNRFGNEALDELLTSYSMQPIAHEVRSLIGTLYNSSEKVSASWVRSQLKKAENSDVSQKGSQLEWRSASLRVYAATNLAIEKSIADIGGYPTQNRVMLLILPVARSAQARRDVAERISETLDQHLRIRERHMLGTGNTLIFPKKNQDGEEDAVIEGQIKPLPFPVSKDEVAAFSQTPKPKIPPIRTTRELSETYLIKGRSRHDYHSVRVLRSSGLPALVVALGQMPRHEIESPLSDFGKNFTCIAEIHPNMLMGVTTQDESTEGDGDN